MSKKWVHPKKRLKYGEFRIKKSVLRKFIKRFGRVTAGMIAHKFGVNGETAGRYLEYFENEGLLVKKSFKIKKNNTVWWEVK